MGGTAVLENVRRYRIIASDNTVGAAVGFRLVISGY
jgi:hypothetical protein